MESARLISMAGGRTGTACTCGSFQKSNGCETRKYCDTEESGGLSARKSLHVGNELAQIAFAERVRDAVGPRRAGLRPGGQDRPRAAGGGEHHHHLVCEQCGQLVAFDDPGLERAIDRLSERLGVRIESHDVLLRGACRRCG